jgi:DNA-binding response OmpR family regulator
MARILVINDDAAILRLYEDLLSELGHEAVTQATARTGPQTVRDVQADMLVVDLQQPDEHEYGLRIIEEIRATPDLTAFPIVLCSGATEELAPVLPRLASLDIPVLQKPFEVDELARTVETALRAPQPES